jgi:phage terminase small subunit
MPVPSSPSGLSAKQERFAEEYLIDLDAGAAAIRAGYSAHSAKQIGYENLTHPLVSEAIKRNRLLVSEIAQINAAMVLKELGRLGFSDIRSIFTQDGRLRPLSSLSRDQSAAIASIEVVSKCGPVTEDGIEIEYTHKVKLWDKVAALTNLARHLGMFDADKSGAGTTIVIMPEDQRRARIEQLRQKLIESEG